MYSLTPNQILRFWKWVKKTPGKCWEWQGSLTKNGYGRFQVHPKTLRAHRVAYFLFKGEIPNEELVCHTCDNPKCVNPEHLWIGSPRENVLDMFSKNRIVRSRSKHKDSISSYAGISFRKGKKSKPWRARIMRNYQTIWCKKFDCPEEAHQERLKVLNGLSKESP